MAALPRITTLAWVPEFARGQVRDVRARWAFEEVGQPYAVSYIRDPKISAHRCFQPFGQVPTYCDDEVEIFESGAITLWIAERAGQLVPQDPGGRMKAIQWMIAALNTVEPAILALFANDVFEAGKPWSADRRPLVLDNLETRLRDLAAIVEERTWLDGEVFTIGDLTMISSLALLRGTAVLDQFPGLAAYVARGEARPAHQKAMADHLAGLQAEAA